MSKLADKNSFTQQKGTTQSNPSSAVDLERSDLHGLHLAADLHGGAAAIQMFKQETMGRSIKSPEEGHARGMPTQEVKMPELRSMVCCATGPADGAMPLGDGFGEQGRWCSGRRIMGRRATELGRSLTKFARG